MQFPSSRRAACTAAAAAAALGLLSACGHGGPQPPPGPPLNVNSPVISDYVPATGAQFAAGAADRRADAELEYRAAARCMTSQGRAAPADTAAGVSDGDVDNSQFPDLTRITATGRFIPPGAQPAAQVTQASAFGICARKASALFQTAEATGQALQDQWMTDVAAIEASPPVRVLLPAYQACLASAGVPVSAEDHDGTPEQATLSSVNALGDFLAWETGQAQASGNAGTARWARVFGRCAAPVVQETEKEQLAAKSTFLREHMRQAFELEQDARNETARAEQQYGTPPA